MIRGFANAESQRIWNGERSRKLPRDIQDRALVKLKLLNRAKTLDDLRNPPATAFTPSKMTGPASTPFP